MSLTLGRRGVATNGDYAGWQVFADSVGMTPVDPLALLLSPNLDDAAHAEQKVLWVNPEDWDRLIGPWSIKWGSADQAVADRLLDLAL